MQYEVERKFRVDELSVVARQLTGMGVELSVAVTQVDCYFAHPSRDFGSTDEAFRIRRVGAENRVTYKGPKIDPETKTRRELELPLPSGEAYADSFVRLLEQLGFSRVAAVRKRRRTSLVPWQETEVEVSLDEVDQVGCFVELELVSDEAGLSAARRAIGSLAVQLQLTRDERRSYLELLLESGEHAPLDAPQ